MANYTTSAVLGATLAAVFPHINVSPVQTVSSDASVKTEVKAPITTTIVNTQLAAQALGSLSWNASAQPVPGGNNQQPCTSPQGCGGIPGLTQNFNNQNNPFYQQTQNFMAVFAPGMSVPSGLCSKGWSVSLAGPFAAAGFSKADQDRECNRWRVLEAGAGNAICPIAYAAMSYAIDPTQIFRDLMKEGFAFCVDYERAIRGKPKDTRDGFNIINPGTLGQTFAGMVIPMPRNDNKSGQVMGVSARVAIREDRLQYA